MGWTVTIENENGKEEKILPYELEIHGFDTIDNSILRLIKYLDPYGDAIFNSLQLDDLLADITELANNGRIGPDSLADMVSLIVECKNSIHTYLKFHGD